MRCPHCSFLFTAIVQARADHDSDPGDMMICNNCAGWCVINDDLVSARKPSEWEQNEIANNPTCAMIQAKVGRHVTH